FFRAGGAVWGDPVIGSDGTVFIGTENGEFFAVKAGVKRWSFKTANPIDGSALAGADGMVYFSGYDGVFHALGPDGQQRWFYQMGGQSASSPALGEAGTLYVGGKSGLYALSSGSKGLAASGWPRFGKNNRNWHH
ncbi:MAG TPA: PQQ-binding-like beta-propeller repeat protein, partial [Candidatus Obscuribacterales bacterium]